MDYHLTRQQGRRHYVMGADTACGSRWGALETDPMLTTCPDCLLLMGKHREASAYTADTFRRAELDSELQAMGATIIQVKDLGAALEANRAGQLTLLGVTWAASGKCSPAELAGYPAMSLRADARHAAHLARPALGESS